MVILASDVVFQQGEIINAYEMRMLALVETVFEKPYRCLAEVPLQKVCAKTSYLSFETWRFWKNSRIDIVIMRPNGKAGLVIECQSSFHDCPKSKKRDSLKANILSRANIPLVYVRYDRQSAIYKFWMLNGDSITFDFASCTSYSQLANFLRQTCLE